MHILKKKSGSQVTTAISREGDEYRVRLFINRHPQSEADRFADTMEEAERLAEAMREECAAHGVHDATKSTKEEIRAVVESEPRVDLTDEEAVHIISDRIYKPILHRFGLWQYEAEEYRVYSGHDKLSKELMEELWGIRYDLEVFSESGLYVPPDEPEPWHESPSCLWDIMLEKTTMHDFSGYDRYKTKRDAE